MKLIIDLVFVEIFQKYKTKLLLK